jgi:hypothetical protein
LFLIAQARRSGGFQFSPTQRWEKHCRQYRDNRNHHQQLN